MGFSQPRLVRAKMVDVSKFTDILGQPDPPPPPSPFFMVVGENGQLGLLEQFWIHYESCFRSLDCLTGAELLQVQQQR